MRNMSSEEQQPRRQQREAFGRALTAALTQSGMTQSDLSERLGGLVAQSTISEWKRGMSEPSSPAVTFEVEQALGVEPGLLAIHLGYVPPLSVGRLETALLQADDIEESWRQVLLAVVRQIKRESAG